MHSTPFLNALILVDLGTDLTSHGPLVTLIVEGVKTNDRVKRLVRVVEDVCWEEEERTLPGLYGDREGLGVVVLVSTLGRLLFGAEVGTWRRDVNVWVVEDADDVVVVVVDRVEGKGIRFRIGVGGRFRVENRETSGGASGRMTFVGELGYILGSPLPRRPLLLHPSPVTATRTTPCFSSS